MSSRHNRYWPAAVLALAFAVPASTARAQAAAPSAAHKSIGVQMQGDESGVQVVAVLPGSPSEKAGVKAGDQVVSIAGTSIFELDPEKLRSIADTAKSLAFVVVREGQKMTFDIVPAFLTPPAAPAPR